VPPFFLFEEAHVAAPPPRRRHTSGPSRRSLPSSTLCGLFTLSPFTRHFITITTHHRGARKGLEAVHSHATPHTQHTKYPTTTPWETPTRPNARALPPTL